MSGLIHSILVAFMGLGYIGIALGLMIEVIPSEIVLAYAGYLVSQGKLTFLGAVIAGTIGGLFAQLFLYWIGQFGGRPFLRKYGKFLLIGEYQINRSEVWFRKYGMGVIFTARFIPVVRHAISIPAGISKMPLRIFTLYTTLAIIPWSVIFIYLGQQLAKNWANINTLAKPYVQTSALAAAVVMVIYFVYIAVKRKKQ
ncbi:DedA family protein [Ectobacillus ponti]|uniref:DedA family protein n=1 Tax=Ectobacillus ponti TaxID=2961894 RepID=A0AA42BRU0_9BACI|nr:DedA family protein [Ectobacillus ponti]MCP8971337.1 DedA family protein [Ectobacillus ponti]